MLENYGIMFLFISLRQKLHGILVLYFLSGMFVWIRLGGYYGENASVSSFLKLWL